jgi:hypothetical protein
MQKKQYRQPPIQEHLVYSHLICMYMIVDVHTVIAVNIFIYICVYIMLFLEVTILFSPETPEKIRDGILPLFI